MNLSELFDMNLFEQMIEEKMITVREHEAYPLMIANYSDLAQYANCWNDVTMNCRGLIYEKNFDQRIVARPWKKFFNLGDAKTPHFDFDERCEVTDKMDGSLGILYVWPSNKLRIATRGSFHSAQAEWATREIQKYQYILQTQHSRDYTFLFEIIYPKNRIVVDYGTFSGLILLGAVQINTGYVLGPYEACAMLNWPGLVTEVMPYRSISDVLAAPHRENAEGVVVRAGNRMVKFKYPDYIDLHRLISNLSEKSVWSGLEGGKTVDELIEGLPDEFHGFVRDTHRKLVNALVEREDYLIDKFGDYWNDLVGKVDLNAGWGRKAFALAVKDDPDKKYMFALLDQKSIEPMIWQELKPRGDND